MRKSNLAIIALSAALALSLFAGRSGGAQATHQTAYEYKVVTSFNAGKDEQKISDLGAQGWELVQVIPALAGGTYVGKSDLIFRRQR